MTASQHSRTSAQNAPQDLGTRAPLHKICVLGLGYIGLPTAAMFASHGFQVVGVDINERVVETLNQSEVHIHEPGLKTLVQAALKTGNLRVARQPEPADVFIIAVPTPLSPVSGPPSPKADLSYVIAAAESIVPHLRSGNLIILESTVPPRTTVDILVPILERSGIGVSAGQFSSAPVHPSTSTLYVAHCPERVLPGRILEELVCNDRVIGGVDQASAEMAKALYASFVEGEIFLTDATTAEMVKLMENTYRDVNIALANEFALVAERLGINVWEAIELANRHPRVNILKPGPGVGGHCLAVDPWFIVQVAPEVTPLIQTARRVNDSMPAHVVELVKRALAEGKTGDQGPETEDKLPSPVSGPPSHRIAVLGLAYKANINDLRESPALRVVEGLAALSYELRLCDPHVNEAFPWPLLPLLEAVKGADCLVLLTDHAEFTALRPQVVGPLMRHRRVVDARGCIKVQEWVAEGFQVMILGDG